MKELMAKIANSPSKGAKLSTKKAATKKVASKTNSLLASMVKESSVGVTENGAKTFTTTLNSNLDLFALGGALRTRTEAEVVSLFSKANAEDPLLALKNLFHIRNIRGGAGERKTFRTILKYLGEKYPEYVKKNIGNIVYYGRFDDLFVLFGTRAEEVALNFISSAIESDLIQMEQKLPISLAGKWLPSANASSAQTKKYASQIIRHLGVTERVYRKTLSALRSYLKVVEVAMSNGQWDSIDYSKVPSKAALNYKGAFKKHDPTGYQNYLDSVAKGQVKINASTLFPYEIVDKVLYKGHMDQTIDLLWEALPNYLEGNDRNILCVCDVSDSMTGLPMAVSISLGIYTAERNKGPFKDYFLTFSDNPSLAKVTGKNITEKIYNLYRANWGMSTNVQAAFSLLLKHAVKNNCSPEELPEQVLIISDMEFNSCGRNTNLEAIQKQYKAAGYKMPQLVFWNVQSRNNNVPAQANDAGVVLVSGCSPSVFKTLLSGKQYTPEDQMMETLNSSMYNQVVV